MISLSERKLLATEMAGSTELDDASKGGEFCLRMHLLIKPTTISFEGVTTITSLFCREAFGFIQYYSEEEICKNLHFADTGKAMGELLRNYLPEKAFVP